MSKKRRDMPEMNRVWIELEKPRDDAHGVEIANLANKMMDRLIPAEPGVERREFFWSAHERRYCLGGNMGYVVLIDWGEWFNLDYLGRDE